MVDEMAENHKIKDQRDVSETGSPSVSWLKLFKYADALDLLLMFFGAIGALAHGAAFPVTFLIFGKVVNSFGKLEGEELVDAAKYLALDFFYIGLTMIWSGWLEVGCWMYTGERQASRIRKAYLQATLNQEIAFFDDASGSNDLLNQISTNTLLIQDAISEKVGQYMHSMATCIGGLLVGGLTSWRIALTTLATIPVIATTGVVYTKIYTGLNMKGLDTYAEANKIVEQAISQIRTTYSIVGEARAVQAYDLILKKVFKIDVKSAFVKGLGVGFIQATVNFSWALQLWYGSKLVLRKNADGGNIITSIFCVIFAGVALGQASEKMEVFGQGKIAAYRAFETIDREPLIRLSKGKKLDHLKGEIELKEVTFRYPSRPDAVVLDRFSITIAAGKTTALVGRSGCGKSTVISLIERFYDPNSGSVFIDEVNIKDLDVSWLRKRIGLISQEPVLISGTIEDNIAFGKDGASAAEIVSAAQSANAFTFINDLPQKFKTKVGENGAQLSGGQKQQITIARTILKNPKILLLDEPTSALDASSEKKVQEALTVLMQGGRTALVVAHQLFTIRYSDSIAVVRDGKVVEQGTHDELLRSESQHYANLASLHYYDESVDARESLHDDTVASGTLALPSSSVHVVTDDASPLKELSSFGWYWNLIEYSDWPAFIVGTLGAAASGGYYPLTALFFVNAAQSFFNDSHTDMSAKILKWSLAYGVLGFAAIASNSIQHGLFGKFGGRITWNIRVKMLTSILKNEVAWFDEEENKSSIITQRLSKDATLVKATLSDRTSIIIQDISSVVIALAIGLVLEWRVAMVMLALFPCFIAAGYTQQVWAKGFAGDEMEAHSRANAVAAEGIANIRMVYSLCMERKVVKWYEEELEETKNATLVKGVVSGLVYGVSQFALYSAQGLVLWYCTLLAQQRNIPVFQSLKAYQVLAYTGFALSDALLLAPDVAKGGEAVKDLMRIIARETKIAPDVGEKVKELVGSVEFDDVVFSYPLRPQVTVLNKLKLSIAAGRKVGLVGRSGSGKSSIVALLLRFYDCQMGTVKLDGVDVKKMHLKWLREHISYVQQQPALFDTTIRENIKCGKEDATESEIVNAVRIANAEAFIASLPDGYETRVGEMGRQMSGGEKQRIAIARAVLRSSSCSLILMDEATSALDAESEMRIERAWKQQDEEMKRSKIIVAHRLRSVREVDEIFVIERGVVVEHGSHQQLISAGEGAYLRLLQDQQSEGNF